MHRSDTRILADVARSYDAFLSAIFPPAEEMEYCIRCDNATHDPVRGLCPECIEEGH